MDSGRKRLMTTFGGATIPPLFGGSPAIGLIGIGASIQSTQAIPILVNTPVPKPTYSPGDTLIVSAYCFSGATGPLALEIANWILVAGAFPGGTQNLWYRQATGTAADDFTVAPRTPGFVSVQAFFQMASFRTRSGTGLVWNNSGTLQNAPIATFPIPAIVAGALTDTLIISQAYKSGFSGAVFPVTLSPIPGATPLGSFVVGELVTFQTYSWSTWGFTIQGAPAIDPAVDIPYTTAIAFQTGTWKNRFRIGP